MAVREVVLEYVLPKVEGVRLAAEAYFQKFFKGHLVGTGHRLLLRHTGGSAFLARKAPLNLDWDSLPTLSSSHASATAGSDSQAPHVRAAVDAAFSF